MSAFLTAEDVIKKVNAGEALENEMLSELDLRGADLQQARFIGVTFDRVNLARANLQVAIFENAIFNRVNMNEANLANANLTAALFINPGCKDTNFSNTDLSDAIFFVENTPEMDPAKVEVDLNEIGLPSSALDSLKEMNISGFSKGHAILTDADFSGALLAGTKFDGVTLKGRDLYSGST